MNILGLLRESSKGEEQPCGPSGVFFSLKVSGGRDGQPVLREPKASLSPAALLRLLGSLPLKTK